MAQYIYRGLSPKIHAGGYVFKRDVPREVNESTLSDKARAQFTANGIAKMAPNPAPAAKAETPVKPTVFSPPAPPSKHSMKG